MKLPILLSVPHAGLRVPPEVAPLCRLTLEEIVADGDEGAAEIYALGDGVAEFATSDIARAIVDLNRADYDRRIDGVVKTHTCWQVPVYHTFPKGETIDLLLERYYYPYHDRLREPPGSDIRLNIDCHTMAAVGPPIGPDTGSQRPHVCLGDCHGETLPPGWMDKLHACFLETFGPSVTVNQPFAGGYITQSHGGERPWVQLEISRAPFHSNEEKRRRVREALRAFCLQIA